MSEECKEIIAYKGFNQDWTCLGYQYEVGKTYEHKGDVKVCESGFHACEYPLDVLGYYNPAESKFAVVKMSGKTSKDSGDTKIASARITIETEINLPEMVKKAVKWIKLCHPHLVLTDVSCDDSLRTNYLCGLFNYPLRL